MAKLEPLRPGPCDIDQFHSPAVTSVTLLANWDARARAALDRAVVTIGTANPYLSGRLEGSYEEGSLMIAPAVHKVKLEVIEGPADFALPAGLRARLAALRPLEPLVLDGALGDNPSLIELGGPLWRAAVVELPGGHAMMCFEVSHIIVDGAGYYKVLQQLNDAANGRPLTAMTWQVAPKSAACPDHYSAADVEACTASFIPAFVERMASQDPPGETLEVFDKDALIALKAEYLEKTGSVPRPAFLSSNDIITAGCAEVARGASIKMFAHMRGRCGFATETKTSACNWERGIDIDRRFIEGNPAAVRKVVSGDFYYYATDATPRDTLAALDFAGWWV